MCLLKANTEEGGRAVAADEMAHARTVEHRRLHVLLVTAREQEIDHEIDRKANRDRSRVESEDKRIGARTRRLTCGRPGLDRGVAGLHACEHTCGHRDLGADGRYGRYLIHLTLLALVLCEIGQGGRKPGGRQTYSAG